MFKLIAAIGLISNVGMADRPQGCLEGCCSNWIEKIQTKSQKFETLLNCDKSILEVKVDNKLKGTIKLDFLSKADEVVSYFIATDGERLLVSWEFSDLESGNSYLAAYDLKDLTRKWYVNIGGFNTGPMLVKDGYAYSGAIGNIMKVKIRDGKVSWKHENLYKKYGFNSLKTVEADGPIIKFLDGPRVIAVDDATGKIIDASSTKALTQ